MLKPLTKAIGLQTHEQSKPIERKNNLIHGPTESSIIKHIKIFYIFSSHFLQKLFCKPPLVDREIIYKKNMTWKRRTNSITWWFAFSLKLETEQKIDWKPKRFFRILVIFFFQKKIILNANHSDIKRIICYFSMYFTYKTVVSSWGESFEDFIGVFRLYQPVVLKYAEGMEV